MMKIIKFKHPVFWFSILLFTLYSILFFPISFNLADTPNFIGASKILFGDLNAIDTQSRITKPFVLLIPGFLNYCFNIPELISFRIQNAFFFVGLIFLIKKTLETLGFNYKEQILGLWVYLSFQTFAYTSTMLICDIAGQFYAFLMLYFYFKNQQKWNIKHIIVLILLFVIGFLSKESAGIALIPIGVDVFFNQSKKKGILSFLGFIISLIIIFLIQKVIANTFGQKNIFANIIEEFYINNGFVGHYKQIIHAFDLQWLFILYGFLILCYSRKINTIKTWFYSFILSLPCVFIWSTIQDRTVFAIAPVLLIVTMYGVRSFITNDKKILLLVIFGFMNLVSTYFIFIHNVNMILPFYYIVGSVIFIIFFNKSIVGFLKRSNG